MSKLPGRPAIDIRVTKELEGTETVGFRHMFKGWDNVLSIDYSKAVDTVPEKELQLRKDRQVQTSYCDLGLTEFLGECSRHVRLVLAATKNHAV